MTKLTALIEVAKAATSPYADDWELKQALLKFDRLANPATILELCALLEKAEDALEVSRNGIQWYIQNSSESNGSDDEALQQVDEALAAIKQWKEQS